MWNPELRPTPPLSERETPQNNIAFGLYLPQRILTNEEVESWEHSNGGLVVDTKGRHITEEGIVKRTGIKRRYVANPQESTLYMGEQAASGVVNGNDEVYGVIFSSSYPVGFNQASKLAFDLGLRSRGNLEVGAACSGFVRGLAYIKEHENRFLDRNMLLVASERYSDTCADLRKVNPEEEPSQAQLIFSDGATAMRFTYGQDLQVLSKINHSVRSSDIRMPIHSSLKAGFYIEAPVPYSEDFFRQNGPAVLRTVVREVPPLVDDVVRRANLTAEDIKFVIPHQPSRHLLESLSQRSPNYTYISDIESGNFSSASIPKALAQIAGGAEMNAYREGQVQTAQQYEINPGDKVVFAGFGAGFFASVTVVEFL